MKSQPVPSEEPPMFLTGSQYFGPLVQISGLAPGVLVVVIPSYEGWHMSWMHVDDAELNFHAIAELGRREGEFLN